MDMTDSLKDLSGRALGGLDRYLPSPCDLKEVYGDRLIAYLVIPNETDFFKTLDLPNQMIVEIWQKIYQQMSRKLAELMVGHEKHFSIKLMPRVFYDQADSTECLIFALIADVFVVTERNFVIPNVVYADNRSIKGVEWRCGYCFSANEMRARHCSQCGAPRALLLQEFRSEMR